jgi:hypothetical protein
MQGLFVCCKCIISENILDGKKQKMYNIYGRRISLQVAFAREGFYEKNQFVFDRYDPFVLREYFRCGSQRNLR